MGDQEEEMSHVCAEETFAEAEGITEGTELLKGQYLIQSLLSSGGFGITYIARDSLARQVVIKECFPAELCVRDGTSVEPASPELKLQFSAIKNQFIREARQMAQLVHPNIVPVHQVFEENNTAYMALDMINGVDLVTLAEQDPERITVALLRSVLRQSLKALNFIHGKGLLHRDISPDNIMLDANGHLTLIDFGAAREFEEQNRSTVMAVKDGYSPLELYDPNGNHGFYSDLYSLAATIYFLSVGAAPPSSEDRKNAIEAGQPDPYEPLVDHKSRPLSSKDKQIFATIDRALSMDVADRYESVAAWAKDLVERQREAGSSKAFPERPPVLESEISQIVQRTNKQLDTTKTKPDAKDVPEDAEPEDNPAQKTMFDIFGNPVEDLLDWHEKQEAEIQAREAAKEAQRREEEEQTRRLQEEIPRQQELEEAEAEQERAQKAADAATPRNRLAAFFGRYLTTKHTHVSR